MEKMMPLRCSAVLMPRINTSRPSTEQRFRAANIQPSTCRTEKPTVAAHFAHYARGSRRHHRAAHISRTVRRRDNC